MPAEINPHATPAVKSFYRWLTGLSTASLLLGGYVVLSLLGGMVLSLPGFHRGSLHLVDAVFTATSALCVTGLIVVDTSRAYTPLGQTVLMVLMQIGGLGYMTIAGIVMSILGSRGPLYARKMMVSTLGLASHGEIMRFARKVLVAATLIEILSVLPLWLVFRRDHGTLHGLFHAVFHSISALNNAGFSTFANNLASYRANGIVNICIIVLVVIGGLGFKVWRDLKEWVMNGRRLDLHDKLVLVSTGLLVVLPFLLFFHLEDSFSEFGVGERAWASLFAAVTPRTAGFNTVDYSRMSSHGILTSMSLMFIGGSPGGTAGGVKTVTVLVVILWTAATLRGRTNVSAFKRTIPFETVVKAFQTVTIAFSLLLLSVILLCYTEKNAGMDFPIRETAFEVCSAFGTVGLSVGSHRSPNVSLVADFTLFGKLVVLAAMIAGRAGYLIFAASLIRPARLPYRYAKGEVLL